MRVFVLASLGAIFAAAVLSGCGGGDSSKTASEITPITQAAYVTTRGLGFKMAMSASVAVADKPFTLNATGAFTEHGRLGALNETVDGRAATAIIDLPYVYFRVGGRMIKGKPWGKANLEGFARALGAGDSLNASLDPSRWIDYLKATGQAAIVGHQTLRGERTTHYHVVVDLNRYPSVVPADGRVQARQHADLMRRVTGQSRLPMDVWIDPHQLVRRYQIDVPLCFAGEKIGESVNLELYDYGQQTIPQPPPSFEVSDLSSQLTSSASHGLEQLHC
jgi:hypothetical protein